MGLFGADEDGDLRVFCTGVWVSSAEILTAGHCSESAQEDGNFPEAVGTLVFYSTADEVPSDPSEPPTAHHLAIVVAHDHEHDLSLLRVRGTYPGHDTAQLAPALPPQGAELYFMGQPSKLYWTFVRGMVAANRANMNTGDLGFSGPFTQVTAPIWFGNSGGGAFDANGNLVGISSFLMRNTPMCAFYVAVPSIQTFLAKAHRS